MTDRRYIIYADESERKGAFCSNFFGGVLLAARDREQATRALDAMKEQLGFHRELKWQNIDAANEERYIAFLRLYFAMIAEGLFRVRIMFTQNSNVPLGLTGIQKRNPYFLLYYQFLKHAFGIAYSNRAAEERVFFSVFLDKLPDTDEKANTFKDYIHGMERTRGVRNKGIHLPRQDIVEVDSSQHSILQGLDIILGAMNFRLNNKHRVIPDGKRYRGKRTRAKEKVYNAINREIRAIYPNFNIGVTTARPNGASDSWDQPYRHWIFVPKNYEIDRRLTKNAPPASPT